ncbi:MAG: hypothetical protein AAGD15_01745 [Agrobacterium cavarae]|uniref:hypothetical protein n=1 Tax=Agrobacterium cavarae TaxID=2528239 RepID=UPI0031B3F71D
MKQHLEAEAIFAEHGIEVVPAHVMPAIGQTRALVTLSRIIRFVWRKLIDAHQKKHGFARYSDAQRLRHEATQHGRFVVMTLAETANNKAFIDETSLWLVSDMIRAAEKNFPELVDNDVTAWFAFFDSLPLGWLQYWALDLDSVISKRHALGGMVYERMKRTFGAMAKQPDLLDDRRSA